MKAISVPRLGLSRKNQNLRIFHQLSAAPPLPTGHRGARLTPRDARGDNKCHVRSPAGTPAPVARPYFLAKYRKDRKVIPSRSAARVWTPPHARRAASM